MLQTIPTWVTVGYSKESRKGPCAGFGRGARRKDVDLPSVFKVAKWPVH